MADPTLATILANVRDELTLIEKLLMDQKRNFGLVPWIYEKANVQISRYPTQYVGQYPGLQLTPTNQQYLAFGMQGDEDNDHDLYHYMLTTRIVMLRNMELVFGPPDAQVRYQDADRAIIAIRDVLLEIFRRSDEFFEVEDDLDFGFNNVQPTDINYLVAEDPEEDDKVALDIHWRFTFQKDVPIMDSFDTPHDPWDNEDFDHDNDP